MITDADLAEATGEPISLRFAVDTIDMVKADTGNAILSFIDDRAFLSTALANRSIAVLLVTEALASEVSAFGGETLIVDDPRWYYYMLHNHLAARHALVFPTTIAEDAIIDPSAHVDALGVLIGPRVVVEAQAVIQTGAVIDADAIIRAGAVVGAPGFEHKRTNRGILTVAHDGTATIREGVDVGALSVVGRGFRRRPTIVGRDCRIDFHVRVTHGCQVGERVFIAAGATLAGSTTVGDDCWIGPGAVISDQLTIGSGARVALGAVVVKSVPAGGRVIGNPAKAF